MEWQAGYACGAILIPIGALIATVQAFRAENDLEYSNLALGTDAGQKLVVRVSTEFQTSKDAARVRLLKKGILADSDADVKDKPTFRELAHRIAERLTGCDIAGFNVVRYDWPLLLAEFERAEYPFNPRGHHVIDVMTLFHMKEPRDLTAAVKFYCGSGHSSAHSAFGDAKATWKVLTAQLERYDDLPVDVAELAQLCTARWVELVEGEPVLVKGQHSGKQIRAVAVDDRSYLDWVLALPDISSADAQIIRDVLARMT